VEEIWYTCMLDRPFPRSQGRGCSNRKWKSSARMKFSKFKIGPVDTEMALLIVKKEEITEGKYIARSAGLPSGLNKCNNTKNMCSVIEIYFFQKCHPSLQLNVCKNTGNVCQWLRNKK